MAHFGGSREFAQMRGGPRPVSGVAELQDIFRGCRSVQAEFLARPVRDNADCRGRREAPALSLAAEIDFNGDVPAFVDVNVAVPLEFQNLDREGHVDGSVLVDAIFGLVRLRQRFLAFADEHKELVRAFLDDLEPNEYVPEDIRRWTP